MFVAARIPSHVRFANQSHFSSEEAKTQKIQREVQQLKNALQGNPDRLSPQSLFKLVEKFNRMFDQTLGGAFYPYPYNEIYNQLLADAFNTMLQDRLSKGGTVEANAVQVALAEATWLKDKVAIKTHRAIAEAKQRENHPTALNQQELLSQLENMTPIEVILYLDTLTNPKLYNNPAITARWNKADVETLLPAAIQLLMQKLEKIDTALETAKAFDCLCQGTSSLKFPDLPDEGEAFVRKFQRFLPEINQMREQAKANA